MNHPHPLVCSLVACGALAFGDRLTANAPVPPPGVPPEAVTAVKGVIPKGWTASAAGVTLTIRREKKVGFRNLIGAPPVEMDMPPSTPTALESYEITLRFRPRMTAETREKLHKENEATAAKLDALRDGLRAAHITHKFDDWLPATPAQEKLVAEYRAAQKAMPFHRLPDLYTETNSIEIEDSVRFPLSFVDADEAKECARVKEAIRGLFKAHADQ